MCGQLDFFEEFLTSTRTEAESEPVPEPVTRHDPVQGDLNRQTSCSQAKRLSGRKSIRSGMAGMRSGSFGSRNTAEGKCMVRSGAARCRRVATVAKTPQGLDDGLLKERSAVVSMQEPRLDH